VIETDTLIIGGGPAGSTCAWKLRQAGRESIILDKETFPRLKLCGGWITPHVVQDLELDIAAYPHRLLTFERIHFHFPMFGFSTRSSQHSIRRWEFDQWLLERAGVSVYRHDVRDIRRENGWYVIDGEYRARHLVGAGGTRCPVYRSLFRDVNPHPKYLQTATLEQEFAYDYKERDCHLWFAHKGLPGYAWYVPKADGYVNVGIGAMSVQMKFSDKDIHAYWQDLTAELERRGLVTGYSFQPKGYSYFLRNPVQRAQVDNAYLVGDAAGLATWDLAEGIGPAVRSSILAAESIVTGKPYSLASVTRYSAANALLAFPFKYLFINKSEAAARRLKAELAAG
jgi:flavin-dependent dehydrogenase